MIQNVTAAQFTRFMDSGRTSPALFSCEDESGMAAGEYVIKLRGSVQRTGLLKELLGNKLASHFGLSVPEPALVMLDRSLASLIASSNQAKAAVIEASVGLNFGSRVLMGFSTWPVDRKIPSVIWQTAVNIFAFDALVQNPDRRFDNPNLLVNGDNVLIFDHEIAFSFLFDILPSPTPWLLDHQQYLTNHVFYHQLKSQDIDLTDFTSCLTGLSDDVLDGIFAEVPPEWNNEDSPKIGQHLGAMRDHAEEFAEEVRRFLV
jgi:hypothetical protein